MTKFIKKPLSILLAALMIVSLFAVVPISASAETKPWTDNITTGGEYTCPSTLSHNTIVSGGTEENPVIINITGQTTVQAPIFLRSGYLKIVGNNSTVEVNRGFVYFSGSGSYKPNGDAHLTITDLSLSSTSASNQYIQILSYANFQCQSTFENVTFKNCNINGSGAVVIGSETTHTFKNCTFEDITGYNAGGISIRFGSDVTMEGCTFKNCTRTRSYSTSFLGGGAVWLQTDSKLTLDDCTFENCTGECGAIGIESDASLTLKGNTTITGNANGNLYLPTGATFNVAEDFTGTVGVTTQTAPTDSASVTLASGLADTQAALANNNIVSDNENYGVKYDSNKLFLVVPATYTVTWKNGDDVIKTDTVREGTTPTYDGATPTKAADGDHMYVFSGWDPELAPVTEDVTYTATFTSSADLVEITDHETTMGDLGIDEVMSEWGRSMTAQAALTLAQYMSTQNDGAKCAVLYEAVDDYDLQYAMSDGTTGSRTDFYGYALNDFLPDYKVYYLPVNLNPETIELNLNRDNATVIWYDATDSDGYWSMEAAYYNDSRYLVLKGNSNQPAGTYEWADMRSGCEIIDYDASQHIYFVDGSCTVTVNEDVVTVSGTFTGRDRNTYVVTVTYEAPYYTITDESVNGTVTAGVNGADVTKAKAGKTVLLNVAPADGYRLKSITASAQKTTPENFSDLVALMGDAVFDGDEDYDCGGYTCKVENGKLVVYNGTTLVTELSESNMTGFNGDSDYVEANSNDNVVWNFYVENGEITGIDVMDADADYDMIFSAVSGSKSTGTLQPVQVDLTTVTEGSQYSFTMPAKNVTVKAEFEEAAPAPETFKAYVKKLTGETYTIENLTGETTVAQLKEIIADQIDIPATAQRLIFAGKQLEDAKTLADYNLQKESTIHLVIRSYTVTWLNYDNSELGTTTVQYGATPTYDGATPYKADGADCIYTFSGWSPEVSAVTGDATYTAQFTESEKPEVIKDCNNKYGNFRLYSNVPIVGFSNVNDLLTGAIIPITYGDSNTMIPVQDAKGYSYKFYDQTGTELTTEITDSSSAPGSNYELSDDVTVYTNVINFTRPAGCTAIYIVATAPAPAPAPAKLTLNVGENGKVVMNNGTFGNATVASNITGISTPIDVVDGANALIIDGHSVNIVEGGSINIAAGGEVSFYPSADNTGKITAIPDEGYICTGWYNGDTRYTTKDTIDYQEISENMTLTAKFAPKVFTGNSITLDGNINLNFYINTNAIPNYANAESVTATFTWDSKVTESDKHYGDDVVVVELKDLTPDENGWVKAYVPVNAAQMANQIEAKVYVGDGAALNETKSYSVKEYAETIIADESQPETVKTLVKEMLNYGAMAQTVFNDQLKDKPDKLANAGLSADDRTAIATEMNGVNADKIIAAIKAANNNERGATVEELQEIGEAIGGKWYTTSVIFLDGNTIRHYFDDVNDTRKWNDADGVQDKYFYYKEKAGIAAADLDTLYEFTIGGKTFSYSVLDYAAAVVNSGMNPDAQNLAKALYLYNQAANAYFAPAPAPVENEVISSGSIEDFSTLNVGDYIAKGVGYAADNEYKVVLTGGTYGTESRDGIVVRNGEYNFNAGEYGMGTYSYHVPQPNVFIEDYNENEKFYPAVDGVEGNAFVVVAKDDTQKIITIAGANVTQN